jgi:hypothetical protein
MADQYETVYCIHCKAPIHPQAQVCPRCRGDQRLGAPRPPSAGPAFAQPARRKRWEKDRPTGVTVMGVLMILDGLAGLMLACVMFALAGLIGAGEQAQAAKVVGDVQVAKAGLTILAIVLIPLSLFKVGLAIGLLYMRPWARIVAVVINLLGAAVAGIGIAGSGPGFFNVAMLVLDGFIALYLLTLGPEFSDYY